jgi:hypothetical protein
MAIQKKSMNIDYSGIRYMLIGILVVAAFFGAYKFAQAGSASANSQKAAVAAAPAAAGANAQATAGANANGAAAGGSCCGGDAGAAAGGGSCCGGSSASAAPVTGSANVTGGVQKISVAVNGSYSPNVIKLKAGVPAEITFGQSTGCTGVVVSEDLSFNEDLSAGAKTVKLGGLQPGTYAFHCGMNMVQGQIVVE